MTRHGRKGFAAIGHPSSDPGSFQAENIGRLSRQDMMWQDMMRGVKKG